MQTAPRPMMIIGLVAGLALAACGSGAGSATAPGATTTGATTAPGGPFATTAGAATQPPGNGGAAIDACTLLTDEEIKSATGFSPKRHAAEDLGVFASGCEWELDNVGDASWSITVGVTTSGGRAFYDRYIAPPVGDGEVIEGVGDEAVQGEAAGDVTAVKGDTVFSVLYIEFPARDDVAIALARTIAAKL